MKITDVIADMILDMFDDENETVQIQRNLVAQRVGCVPSQINYVITSRFTPEHGYYVESRRGGGGCILITRAKLGENTLMHLINSIGDSIDEKTCRAHIYNLNSHGLINDNAAKLMLAATSDRSFSELSQTTRNSIRSKLFKQMILTQINR